MDTAMTETLRPSVGSLAACLGGVGLIVGSAAPWASVSVFAFSKDIAGTSMDGKFTLVAGVALLLVAIVSMTAVDWAGWLLVGIGLAAGAVAVYNLVDLTSVGWGLVLCVASAAVAIVGGASEILEL